RLGLLVLARGVLPARGRARCGAVVLLRGAELGGAQRFLLLPAAPELLPALVRANPAGFRLLGQGQQVHHAPQAAAGGAHCAGQLPGVRGAGPAGEAGAGAVAAAAADGVRRGAAGGVLPAAAAHHGRGGGTGPAARRAADRADPSAGGGGPTTAARLGTPAPFVRHRGGGGAAAGAR